MEVKNNVTENILAETQVAVILTYEAEKPDFYPFEEDAAEYLSAFATVEKFTGKKDTTMVVPFPGDPARKIIVEGLGKKDSDARFENIRTATFRAVRSAASKGNNSVTIYCVDATEEQTARAIAEGMTFATYRFNKYIKPDENDTFAIPEEISIYEGNEAGVSEGTIYAESQCYTRDIANEPGNIVTPQVLAAKALELADAEELHCEIWNEERILNEKMGAYSAVGAGSSHAPRFIHMTYTPKGDTEGHIVLVGKGLTFDSGGLNIKPDQYMLTMKGDKSGACAVLGAMRAVAKLKPSWKVSVVIAAAENMPGGRAYRPDDILTARNGKTIEVNNTDAEGRLTLADALVYASELKPDIIVDIATLTGACAVALGSTTAGLFSNSDELSEKLIAAGKNVGEKYWRMPMEDENLRESLKSPVADLVNCGERYGGAITAAMFLEEFVGNNIKWAHLDIAAADFIHKPRAYYVKGSSGFGTRTLIELIKQL